MELEKIQNTAPKIPELVMQSLLAAISAAGAGIVTINQSTPENGAAQVAVAVRTGTMQMTLEELLVRLSRQRTVVEVRRGL